MDNSIDNRGTAAFDNKAHSGIDEAVESLVDSLVTDGMSRHAVLDAMQRSVDRLRKGNPEDPDPAEEPATGTQGGAPLEDPANDWPAS